MAVTWPSGVMGWWLGDCALSVIGSRGFRGVIMSRVRDG